MLFATSFARASVAIVALMLAIERTDAAPAGAELESIDYPTIVMTTDLIPPSTVDNTWLEDRDGAKANAVSVERIPAPITIALVVSSDRAWLRSDEMENDRRPASGYALVEATLRDLQSSSFGPAGSKLIIVTYDREARVTLSSTEPHDLPAQPLGPKTNFGFDGRAVEHGIRLGLDQLAQVPTTRKLLVLLGDGQFDSTRASLEILGNRARDESVEVVAINYPLDFEGERKATRSGLISLFEAHEVKSIPSAVHELRRALSKTRERYRIRLDGRQLAWDGELHPVTLRFGSFDIGPRLLHLPHHSSSPPRATPLSFWRWPLLALTITLLLALVAMIRR